MKKKTSITYGLLAILMLVAGLVVPGRLGSPARVEADPGICKWDTVLGPGGLPLKNDITTSEIHDMAVGGDGATVLLTARYLLPDTVVPTVPVGGVIYNALFYTNNNGISFTTTKWTSFAGRYWDLNLIPNSPPPLADRWPNAYLVAIAPDNPSFWAIVTDSNQGNVALVRSPLEVWITTNAGGKWECTNFNSYQTGRGASAGEVIRCIDISVDYGGKRDIAVGTTDGAGTGNVYVNSSTGFTGWRSQDFDIALLGPLGDFEALKFSPTYASDASLAVVFTEAALAIGGATFYNISLRDIDLNTHLEWAFPQTPAAKAVEVKDPTWVAGSSPGLAVLNRADIELPSDFSGQAASLRRAYISLDAYNAPNKASSDRDGIFRIDDTTVYTLMDTSNVVTKSIYSIAYFGTYASGKLLAGERRGVPCTATVPTWFTDSPTTCPVPCWYPALKPTTGAAGPYSDCAATASGSALMGWKADGVLAFAATGFFPTMPINTWFSGWIAGGALGLNPNDESAFAISRNNGETWNQIALINTSVSKLTDVAPTPDCKTMYLASVNTNATCSGFDSVWRSSSNSEVVAPFPALPIGTFWERVLAKRTSDTCLALQTNYALLRLVPYCADPSGQIVAWGVYDPTQTFTHGIAAWSPDFGDYWANITVRDPIQDFTFESQTVMYFLNPDGGVQKMPYTGTAWSTSLSTVDSIIYGAHSIAAFPEGKVLVGAATGYHASLYAVSYALNFNTDNPSFTVQSMAGRTPFYGDVHVAFDTNFSDTNIYFANDENYTLLGGSVYRNNPQAQVRWSDADMLDRANGAGGCFTYGDPQTGLVLGFTGRALYSSYWEPVLTAGVVTDNSSGVYRTIGPLSGMPKPGITWDDLEVGLDRAPLSVEFTLQPTALRACGCCTLDTDTTLYAIDDAPYAAVTHTLPWTHPLGVVPAVSQQGMLWAFTDCMAKRGPALVTEDKTLIGCDPVSGRAQEVNLCWEQLCVANAYALEIAKDANFDIMVLVTQGGCDPDNFLVPADLQTPCVYFPAGGEAFTLGSAIAAWGNLECGHTYYWHIRVRECATQQVIRSPWSEVRSFTVKAGLPVVSTYLGLTLLAPNNGCLGCPVQPASFSWSPFKETTKYKFQLASDAGMTQLVKEAEVVNSSAYEYDGTLDFSTNYFWRVMCMEPAPSDWSATFSFVTEPKPAEAAAAPVAPTPLWVWVVIAIFAILVILILILTFMTHRK